MSFQNGISKIENLKIYKDLLIEEAFSNNCIFQQKSPQQNSSSTPKQNSPRSHFTTISWPPNHTIKTNSNACSPTPLNHSINLIIRHVIVSMIRFSSLLVVGRFTCLLVYTCYTFISQINHNIIHHHNIKYIYHI